MHTVGPIYDDNEQKRSEMFLNACYKNSIKLAVENGCKSIAFPLISAGVYGYPKYEALKIAGIEGEFAANATKKFGNALKSAFPYLALMAATIAAIKIAE